ncbi:adipolin isoform X1 [Choloepus didactylus]|uniref:adipolin isoform X1 n=1 Tax=Choloepus didactylus TaxID=27675 RepID=UPI00189F0CCB|nr:adipolin isoform X1 [Choloepus didactylus]
MRPVVPSVLQTCVVAWPLRGGAEGGAAAHPCEGRARGRSAEPPGTQDPSAARCCRPPATMRGWGWGWAWAAAMTLLWPQLTLPRDVGVQQEPKRPRPPGQRTEPPNATIPNPEKPPGSPKPPEASGPEVSDAHRTWLDFVRRPNEGAPKKRCRGRGKKLVRSPGDPGWGLAQGRGLPHRGPHSLPLPPHREASLVPQDLLGPPAPQGPLALQSPGRPCCGSSRSCGKVRPGPRGGPARPGGAWADPRVSPQKPPSTGSRGRWAGGWWPRPSTASCGAPCGWTGRRWWSSMASRLPRPREPSCGARASAWPPGASRPPPLPSSSSPPACTWTTVSCRAGPGCGSRMPSACSSASSPCVTATRPWRPSRAWRATAGSSQCRCRGCCSCRLDSMSPSSWTMAPGHPSPSRAAPASRACFWACEDGRGAAGSKAAFPSNLPSQPPAPPSPRPSSPSSVNNQPQQ